MRIITAIVHTIDNISEKSGKLISFLLPATGALLLYEVTLRYFFNNPTMWVHETTQLMFGVFMIVGGAYTLWRKAHVNMDVIWIRIPFRQRHLLDLITAIPFFTFCILLFWYGILEAIFSWEVMERTISVWAPPFYPIRTMVVIGALLILLQGTADFVRNLVVVISGRELQ